MVKDRVIPFEIIKYRKMWKEERWAFSGELTRLMIKNSKGTITKEEEFRLSCMNKVIDENDGNWLDGYMYDDGILKKYKKPKK